MAQLAFFINGVATGAGAAGVLLAWDRFDQGPDGADNIDLNGIGLYTWNTIITGAQLMKIKTKSPIKIPEENCPQSPDGFPDHDYFNRLEVKPTNMFDGFVDFSFEIFEGSTLIYSVAPAGQTLKVELAFNSFISSPFSIQQRPTLQAFEDPLEGFASIINSDLPAKELWRALMMQDQPLEIF